jgi:hypothetical protein
MSKQQDVFQDSGHCTCNFVVLLTVQGHAPDRNVRRWLGRGASLRRGPGD